MLERLGKYGIEALLGAGGMGRDADVGLDLQAVYGRCWEEGIMRGAGFRGASRS